MGHLPLNPRCKSVVKTQVNGFALQDKSFEHDVDTALRAAILPHLVQFKAPARPRRTCTKERLSVPPEWIQLLGATLQGQLRPQLVLDQFRGLRGVRHETAMAQHRLEVDRSKARWLDLATRRVLGVGIGSKAKTQLN